jgi:radial spoke head protein 1
MTLLYFRKNQRHGHGVLTARDGTYEGEWADSSRHGNGRYVYLNGDVYDGEYKVTVKCIRLNIVV